MNLRFSTLNVWQSKQQAYIFLLKQMCLFAFILFYRRQQILKYRRAGNPALCK